MIPSLIDTYARSRMRYQRSYRKGRTPWETGAVPSHLSAFLRERPPGRALDIGCGTGTNAIYMARQGWRVSGVDFSSEAVCTARLNAERAGVKIDFQAADVTRMKYRANSYDFALDIGCLFSLTGKKRVKYVQRLAGLVMPKGWYLLYAWLPRPGRSRHWGILPEEVSALFGREFANMRTLVGEEKGYASAWYWFQRK